MDKSVYGNQLQNVIAFACQEYTQDYSNVVLLKELLVAVAKARCSCKLDGIEAHVSLL